jgi:hypothetical protein
MNRKAPTPDTLVLENTSPAPPKPGLACHKCGTILETEQEKYWHARGDSAGCMRSAMGMILDLHGRLELIEKLFEKAAADAVAKEPEVPA